jgi:hypothetical protein
MLVSTLPRAHIAMYSVKGSLVMETFVSLAFLSPLSRTHLADQDAYGWSEHNETETDGEMR